MLHRNLIAGFVLLSWSIAASAQDDGPRVVKMTLSPAPASVSPMPHPLLPHLREIKPGNAAVFYQRSQSLEWWGASSRKEVNKLVESLESPWSPEFVKSGAWLANSGVLKEIDLAARSEYCDWQLLDRLRSDPYLLLLPDIQSFRTIGALNSARIRMHIHAGEFDKAARGLQTSFAMARHIGEGPSLINYLVGVAMTNVTRARIEDWIAQPEAPSLYWALTDLPRPLIDWRRPMQAEAVMLESLLPEIRQALQEKKPRPIPLEVLHVLHERLRKFAEASSLGVDTIQWSLAIAQVEPAARKALVDNGLSLEEIDRLPVAQTVLMYLMAQHELRSVEFMSIQSLPYWQARPLLKKWADQRIDSKNPVRIEFLRSLMLPSYDVILRSGPVAEREFEMLRLVEALRLFAAAHGRWPDSLDDIRDLPLPVDPFTGKAFAYRLENKIAILEAFAPPGMAPNETNRIRFELTLRPKKNAE